MADTAGKLEPVAWMQERWLCLLPGVVNPSGSLDWATPLPPRLISRASTTSLNIYRIYDLWGVYEGTGSAKP